MTNYIKYQVYLEKCFVQDIEPLTYEEWVRQEYEKREEGF